MRPPKEKVFTIVASDNGKSNSSIEKCKFKNWRPRKFGQEALKISEEKIKNNSVYAYDHRSLKNIRYTASSILEIYDRGYIYNKKTGEKIDILFDFWAMSSDLVREKYLRPIANGEERDIF